jgi:hypothetical protein
MSYIHRVSLAVAVLTVILVLNVGSVPTPAPAAGPRLTVDAGEQPGGPCTAPVCVDVTVNSTGSPVPPGYWGTTISPRARLIPGLANMINATPSQVEVFPGAQAGDFFNPLNSTTYTEFKTWNATLGHYVYTHGWVKAATTEADFVSLCESIRCQAIMQVPGETENATLAAQIVTYTEVTLHFHPEYWEIGNEPELWIYAGQQWAHWPTNNSHVTRTYITPEGYAWVVRNLSIAMQAANNNSSFAYEPLKIIGIPATGRPDPFPLASWVEPVVRLDGPRIVGVAYHSYPAGRDGDGTPQSFYEAINSPAGIPQRIAQLTYGLLNATNTSGSWGPTNCNITCVDRLSIFITEFGSGLSHGVYYQYGVGLPGALDVAAQITQTLRPQINQGVELNITNMDVFGTVFGTSNSWLNFTGWVRPSFTMYSEIFNHLGNVAYPAQLTPPPQYSTGGYSLGNNLYGIQTVDTSPGQGNRTDLMVVNLNLTQNVTLVGTPAIYHDHPTEVWEWQGYVANRTANWVNTSIEPMTSQPVSQFFPDGIPANYSLPLQTIELFETFPSANGTQVTFTASGFTASAPNPRWYVDLGGNFETANGSSSLTFFVLPGTYSVSAPPISLANGTPVVVGHKVEYVKERLEPFLADSVVLTQAASSQPVSFATQWSINLTESPSDAGSVSPGPAWWNASSPLELTANPAFHYAFRYWEGFGNGSVNSTSSRIVVLPTGWIHETANFEFGYPLTFSETGLPEGTDWSVGVRTSFTLDNGTKTVDSSQNGSSMTSTIGLEETNGTYGFTIGAIPGYRSNLVGTGYLQNSSVNVSGSATNVEVQFSPLTPPSPQYPVTFAENGLPDGARWWLTTRNVTTTLVGGNSTTVISNLTQSSVSNSLVFYLHNGSFGYNASAIPGFRAHPPAYGFNVSGPGLVIPIDFAPVLYPVIWEEAGLGPNLTWTVNVTNRTDVSTMTSVGAWTTARVPNGTYAFSISNVDDYLPSLRSGGFSVNGEGLNYSMSFARAGFALLFDASGLPRGMSWQIRVSTLVDNLTGSAASFELPNGSYTFDVNAPPGFLANPSHGTLTVDAKPITINVVFGRAGLPPVPPLWNLGTPAILAAAAVGVVGVTTVLLARRRRRNRSSSES